MSSESEWLPCSWCHNRTPDLPVHEDECYSNPKNRPCGYTMEKICEKAVFLKIVRQGVVSHKVLVPKCSCHKYYYPTVPAYWYSQ